MLAIILAQFDHLARKSLRKISGPEARELGKILMLLRNAERAQRYGIENLKFLQEALAHMKLLHKHLYQSGKYQQANMLAAIIGELKNELAKLTT